MIVRELIHIIGFRINEAQYASVETRVRQLGSMMSFMTTLPIVLMGKSFLEASTKMQMLNLALETYASNSEEAARTSTELQNLALSLPTAQIEDLGDAVNNLLARGVPLKDLVGTFRTMYVITGATGGDFKRLTKAYTDTMGKGKLAGQEVNQYINASVPIYQALEKYLNKDNAAIRIMQKEGKISFEIVKAALNKLAESGGQFANIMEKKSYTLWGVWMKLKDVFFQLKAQLGDTLAKPLYKILEIFSKIVLAIKELDGNWKRFIIILMGVSAVIGPLVVIYEIIKMFTTPIGWIMMAIGIISVLIDDIYVWTQGGHSIMGHLFGDYEQYKPLIEEFKNTILNLFTNLKDLMKEIIIYTVEFFAWFTGKKGAEFNALKTLLWILKEVSETIDTIVFGLRLLGFGLSAPFRSEEKVKEQARDLRERMKTTGGPLASPKLASELGNKLAKPFNDLQEWFNKFGDMWGNLATPKGFTPLKNFPMPQPQILGMLGGNNINISIDAKNAGTPQELYPIVRQAVTDSLAKSARNIKTNMAEK